MTLLLQSRIRRCDKPGRGRPGVQAGGLAARSVNILFKDASLPRGSARLSRLATARFRHEPSWIMRAVGVYLDTPQGFR